MEERPRLREADDKMTAAEAKPLAAIDTSGGPDTVPEPDEAGSRGAELTERTESSEAFPRFDDTPEALFRCHYAGLVRALAVAAGGDLQAAEDAAQDAFVQLCVHWSRVRGYDEPAAWVRRVAINRLRNRDRGLLRRAAALVRLESLFEPAVAPIEPPFDLEAALKRLPEWQRVGMALHYVDGLPVTEVARSMGISEGTANRHLHRARAALHPALEVSR